VVQRKLAAMSVRPVAGCPPVPGKFGRTVDVPPIVRTFARNGHKIGRGGTDTVTPPKDASLAAG
jgi:hypothetical protein